MLIRIYWPKESRIKVKLKRKLFGDQWLERKRASVRIIRPEFRIKRIKRGLIQVNEEDWPKLREFLNSLRVSYRIVSENYLISGPLVLIKRYGVNAYDKSYFRVLADEEMLCRSLGNYPCLEDTIITTFSKALKNRLSWLNYVVMAFFIRRLDWQYMIFRAKVEEVLEEFAKLLGLIFTTLRGDLNIKTLRRIVKKNIRYVDIVRYFNSLHWYNPPIIIKTDKFYGLTPETIVSLAAKQLFYY